MTNKFLLSLGWNDFFQTSYDEIYDDGLYPARIISQGRGHYHLQVSADDTLEAVMSMKLFKAGKKNEDFAAVGDWVAFAVGQGNDKAIIHHVLNRKSSLQRKRAGNAGKVQRLATNVDYMLIVTSMNEDFDMERLERYVDIGKDSGAITAFILTKADLVDDTNKYIQQLEREFPGIEIFTTSAENVKSMDALEPFFRPGVTSVLLGSSGVGKSTLTNHLLGVEAQKTGALGLDSKGRHTTTSRNLLVTRWGGLVIDTPGMQEILALDSTEDTEMTFPDIEERALQCKFTNCRHQNDPGCAIKAALKNGTLDETRWANYLKASAKIPVPKKKWEK